MTLVLKNRKMNSGFTLIELMLAICLMAVLIALLLPEIHKAKDASLQDQQKDRPYWVYREYEYAGGPMITEISGSYKHSLHEILDMYAISLKKQQEKYQQELLAEGDRSVPQAICEIESNVDGFVCGKFESDDYRSVKNSKLEKIANTKWALKNFKYELSQNMAPLVARRNLEEAIFFLEQDLKRLKAMP